MADFPVAQITSARLNVLKGELVVALRVPIHPDNEAAMLQQAAGLRRLFEAEAPVSFLVRPLYEQAELPLPAASDPDWRHALDDVLPAPPDPDDRPTGQSFGDFLSGEES